MRNIREGYVAFDFGASSGRLMLGMLEDGRIKIEEIHRFSNEPVNLGGTLYWDFLRLFHELKQGLKKVAKKNVEIKGIGIDTWGVDFGWLDEDDKLIGNPIHYRDKRTGSIMQEFEQKISQQELYDITGIQKMPFNTIYQIYYDMNQREDVKRNAKSLLFMPDLFGFFLTGQKYNEYTIATTGAMIGAKTKKYSEELLGKLGLPSHFLQKIVRPGTIVGHLTKEIQQEVGLGAIPVVAVGGHDTASAVAGAPLSDQDEVYLVSGTWSLMGMELQEPRVSKKAKECGLTNEGGVENRTLFLKNINGLWFIQELRKAWKERGLDMDYPAISKEGAKSTHTYEVDVADPRFMAPEDMIEEIRQYCKEKYKITLESVGDIARSAYNGLAKEYKQTVESLEIFAGKNVDTIRMVGGGIQDEFLCQHVANCLGRKVLAGPIEASVLGNIMMQMKAVGEIQSAEEGRRIISKSFEQNEYLPQRNLSQNVV